MANGLKAVLAVFLSLVAATTVAYFCFPGFLLDCAKQAIRWHAGLSRHTIQVDDHRWAYLEGGKGETLLFVHGFGMEKDGWGLFPKAFSPSYRLILPDLPGFGENPRLESADYDVPSQVKRLNRFVESLGLDRFHLAGSSMGGYIAGYYASGYPEKVKSLALFAPAGGNSPTPSDMWRLYAETGEIALLYRTREGFEEILRLLFYRVPPVPGAFKTYFAEHGASNYAFYGKVLRDLEQGGRSKLELRLSRVEARTLVVWGANDRILHVSGAEVFRKGLRNVKVVILDQCGHVPFFEKRPETVKICHAESVRATEAEILADTAVVFDTVGASLERFIAGGEIRELPRPLYSALLIGPCQFWAAQHLRADADDAAVSRAAKVLADAAWRSVTGDSTRDAKRRKP